MQADESGHFGLGEDVDALPRFKQGLQAGKNDRPALRDALGHAAAGFELVVGDGQAHHAVVCFDVAAYDDMVRLTVTHDELEAGSGMAKGIQEGWPIVLSSLKSLLETGQGIDVFAKPKAA